MNTVSSDTQDTAARAGRWENCFRDKNKFLRISSCYYQNFRYGRKKKEENTISVFLFVSQGAIRFLQARGIGLMFPTQY